MRHQHPPSKKISDAMVPAELQLHVTVEESLWSLSERQMKNAVDLTSAFLKMKKDERFVAEALRNINFRRPRNAPVLVEFVKQLAKASGIKFQVDPNPAASLTPEMKPFLDQIMVDNAEKVTKVKYTKQDTRPIELAAIYGAKNCFVALLDKAGGQLTVEILDAVVSGGNNDILEECLKRGASFEGLLQFAVECHRNNFCDIFMEKYPDDANGIDFAASLGASNMRAALYALQFCGVKHAFHDAVRGGSVTMCNYFIEARNEKVDSRDDSGRTPLMIASAIGEYDVAEYLIQKGADVNAKDYTGTTPLIYASFYNFLPIVELLLNNKADVNALRENGENAITAAVAVNAFEIVKMLRWNECIIQQKNADGVSNLKVARDNGFTDMAEFLKNNGATD